MRALLHVGRVLLAVSPALGVVAQQPQMGEPAPPVSLSAWLNTEEDSQPTLESLRGRVVMIEFWGTWCGPCVRAMPEVQKLHDRYGDRGLTVLAISYEPPEKMRPFLEKNGYTMAVGSDPERKVVNAYGVESWPTTFVIARDGTIAHVGGPYDAEAAVEKALGLESSPSTLLTLWLDSRQQDEEEQREAITRLMEKAPADFDLRAWARANGGAEPAVTDAGEGAGGGGLAEAAAKTGAEVDGGELLTKCVEQWTARKQDKLEEALHALGAAGPTEFDLASFVRRAYGEAFPIDRKEMRELLKARKFNDVLDAIVLRNPGRSVLALAARDDGLHEYCSNKLEETRKLAKKGMMVQGWVFGGVQPKDNEGFWGELAVSGIATSKDRKEIVGVLIGGSKVTRAMVETFVRDHIARAILMEALADGKAPRLRDLDERIAERRARILEPLEHKYGPIGGKK